VSLSAPFTRRRATRRASSTASACPLAASLTESELQHLPVRLVDASADVFFDPVLEEAFDEPALCQLRAVAGEAAGASWRHAAAAARQDLRRRHHAAQRNDAARAHTFKIHLPPIAPQYIIDGERVPAVRGAAGAHRRDAVHDGAEYRDQSVSRRRVSRRAGADSRRVGAGRRRSILANVAVQNWRRAPTASCSPARGATSRSPSSCSDREVFSPHDLADLEAEARLLGQLLHKSIVWASRHLGLSRRAAASYRAGAVWLAQVGAGQSR